MYRLLKVNNILIQSTNNNVHQGIIKSKEICSFCLLYHLTIFPKNVIYSQIRYESSYTVALPFISKFKKKTKKYAELLEVSDNQTNTRKAIIRKLNASHLSELLINQNKLGSKNSSKTVLQKNTKSGLHTSEEDYTTSSTDYTNKSSMVKDNQELLHDYSMVVQDLETSGISDPASIIRSTSLLNSISGDENKHEDEIEINENNDSKMILKKKNNSNNNENNNKNKNKNIDPNELLRLKEIQLESKNDHLIRSLNSYLQVCISCKMIGRAYYTVMHYRSNNTIFKQKKDKHIIIYNTMLDAYANRLDLKKIKEFIEIIHQDNIKPNVKTFVSIFECFGRLKDPKTEINYLNKILSFMMANNITYEEILNNSKFKLKQHDIVLKALSSLNYTFKPTINTLKESYDCPLLKDLALENVAWKSPAENLLSVDDIYEKYKKQLENEMTGYVKIKSIEKFDNIKPFVSHYKKEISQLEIKWQNSIGEAFERDFKALKNREHRPVPNSMVLYPYLNVLDKNEYINMTLHEIRKLIEGSETFSPSYSALCKRLGKSINNKFEIIEKTKNGYIDTLNKVYLKYSDWYINRNVGTNSRTTWKDIECNNSQNYSLELESFQWPVNIHYSIGKFLYEIILKDVRINVNCFKSNSEHRRLLPAFYKIFRKTKDNYLVEEIKPHPILNKLFRESQIDVLNFDTSLAPSECPPRPWTSIHTGGYMLLKSDIVRVPMYAMEQWKRLESLNPVQLWPALDSLNQLGSIPWTVNTPILNIAIKIFQDGGSAKLNVPQSPSVLTPAISLTENTTDIDRKTIIKARIEFRRKKNEMYSLWCDALYRLSLANHFRNKIFWLPHNMDFRGRVYPLSPHLNHLGSDLARSMLIFALGKPLGPNGLNWLKVHTINLTGFKKRESIKDRLNYANEILDDIIDSAEKPLTGKMWWTQSDEPWQTLAACMEINSALKTPNPEEYICQFPIHQDGSCNGLQHYAALGRDKIGAESVNLENMDKPQDVYSNVVNLVEERRRKDAENGNEIAHALEGFIKRKVIKQTVMTTVYGVTRFGARLQIARQLKDLDNFPQEYVWSASMYLAVKTFDSLRSMFDSAKKIQDWFTDCARVISTDKNQNIEWITPLGLPVIQPYSKLSPKYMIKFAIDSCEKPNTTKQKNAFAPNFVHSLDSSHMMLTSLLCENAGITFVSVHDCYWTHPCTVEIMNKICREQFVALHSQPILEDLSQFFMEKYINKMNHNVEKHELDLSERKLIHILSNVPKKGSFDLRHVLNSTYFFS